ncbi:MAG: hypothetical protein AAFY22_04880 [Pseudomonadota bacterium]
MAQQSKSLIGGLLGAVVAVGLFGLSPATAASAPQTVRAAKVGAVAAATYDTRADRAHGYVSDRALFTKTRFHGRRIGQGVKGAKGAKGVKGAYGVHAPRRLHSKSGLYRHKYYDGRGYGAHRKSFRGKSAHFHHQKRLRSHRSLAGKRFHRRGVKTVRRR